MKKDLVVRLKGKERGAFEQLVKEKLYPSEAALIKACVKAVWLYDYTNANGQILPQEFESSLMAEECPQTAQSPLEKILSLELSRHGQDKKTCGARFTGAWLNCLLEVEQTHPQLTNMVKLGLRLVCSLQAFHEEGKEIKLVLRDGRDLNFFHEIRQ